MSKTDKDRPFWVIQNDSSIYREAYHDHVDYLGNDVDCDIHLDTVREDKYRADRNCGYDVVKRYSFVDAPSRKKRHNDWFGPARSKTRDAMISQVKEFNSLGYIESDSAEPGDHRHAPMRGTWW